MGLMRANSAGVATRVLRTARAELLKAGRQRSLYLYLCMVLVCAALSGPLIRSSTKAEERGQTPPARVTHTFGEAQPPNPGPATEKGGEAAGDRGANGFLVLAGSLLFGNVLATILILLFSSLLLAGEDGSGTFRMVLTRPVRRSDVVLGKALLVVVVTAGAAIVVAGCGYLLGLVFGGYGPYVDVRYGGVDYTAAVLTHIALITLALGVLPLLAAGCLGLLISSLFESGTSALIGAMLVVFGTIASILFVPGSQRWNFGYYAYHYPHILEQFAKGLSEYRFDSGVVLPGIIVPTASALVFLIGALIIFGRRDIHS